MKYKKLLFACVAAVWFTVGCSGGQETGEEDVLQEETADADGSESTDIESAEKEKEEDVPQEGADVEEDVTKTVKIYYIDDMGELASREADVEDEQAIWAEMKKDSVLAEECELLGFKVNEADKTLDLDFNRATGDRIRSFGTAGETEILACLTNTYLDAYGCDRIRITEEGEALSTSHGAAVDGYMERITL